MLIAAALLPGAGCRKYDGKEAAAQREEWTSALADSITAIAARRQTDSLRLEQIRAELAERISDFSQVNNPREVEPYYILSRFRGRYPLAGTGIAARMMNNEQAELVAALSGHRFNAIRISCDGQSVTSSTVPADQALNYTSGGLTTVAFTGAGADSICALVAGHASGPVTIEYLQDGAVARSLPLTPDQKEWLAGTWAVCGAHKEARFLEKRMLTDSRKIELLRITLDSKTGRGEDRQN